jgi:multidrug efflux system outer membrane protein
MARYQGGTTTYPDVLDAHRSIYSAEVILAEARGNEYGSLVQLFKTLGAGRMFCFTRKKLPGSYSP